jgi:hypothetical protein
MSDFYGENQTSPPSPPQAANPATRPRIAVLAVHGIGDHEAGSSAKDIADLLLRLRQDAPHDAENRFTSFRRADITIPVKRAFVSESSDVRGRSGEFDAPGLLRALSRFASWRPAFQERSNALESLTAQLQAQSDGTAGDPQKTREAQERATDGADHQFMRAQLAHYPGGGTPYATVRYEGHRVPPGAPDKPDADVHVYEMFWADLSRLGSGFVGTAYELFQLLFHIPHLGRQAVDHAVLEHANDRWWTAYRAVHTAAVRTFTLFIPLLWLVMAATALAVVPSAASANATIALAVIAAAAGGAVLGAAIAYRGAERRFLTPWLSIPIVSGLAAWLTGFVLGPMVGAAQVLTIEWILLSTAAVVAIAGKYDRVRPGARATIWWLALPPALVLLVAVAASPTRAALIERVLHVFELETVAVLIVWNVFYVYALSSGLLGLWTTYREKDREAKRRARQVAWTARATLAMATVSVLVVGFPVWALVYKAFSFALPKDGVHLSFTELFGIEPTTPAKHIEQIFHISAGPGFPLVLAVTALVFLVLSFTIIPSVWAEVRPKGLRGGFAGDPAADPRKESDSADRLGRWLSRGLRIVQSGVSLLFITVIAAAILNVWHWIALAWSLAVPVSLGTLLGLSAGMSQQLVLLSGAWLSASALSLAALRGRFKKLVLGFGPLLDAVLDVDNYLREHPRSATPRARIAERYASMLRYLCKWRDKTGMSGYDAIVIVAHSQGTVITTDYLGFIKREHDPDLPLLLSTPQRLRQGDRARQGLPDGPALYLFTMGSPLQQLYSVAFPHLFSWVRGDEGPWRRVMEDPTAVAGSSRDAMRSPNPTKMGLERWVNAYRSGDYVGRALWRHQDATYTYRPFFSEDESYWEAPTVFVSEDTHGYRRELCIGEGAHTHYWDETASLVAVELDRLIGDAANIQRQRSAMSGRTNEAARVARSP